MLISTELINTINKTMESIKPNKKLFTKLRAYEQKHIMSFLSLEDFTDKDFINKKFYQFFKNNYKKLIINYILCLSKKKTGDLNLNKTNFNKFHKKFIKNIFFNENSFDIKDNPENKFFEEKELEQIIKQNNFRNFLENFLLKRFIDFAAYKNEGGYFQNMDDFHFQNMFDYENNWFCSKLNNKAFNVYATVYYDITCINAPYINQEIAKEIIISDKEKLIQLKLKEIKNIINLCFDCDKSDFNKISDQYGPIKHKDPITKKFMQIDFKTYEISGINKFIYPGRKDPKFFDKIFEKNKNWNFLLDSFSINNIGAGYTCPIKTLAVYIHDEKELNQQDLDLLKEEFHEEKDLLSFLAGQIHFNISSKEENSNNKKDEFFILNHINELEQFERQLIMYEFDTMRQRFAGRNLKLLAWLSIPIDCQKFFDLAKLVHFGRHLIVKPINQHKINTYDKNIDIKSIHFFGGVIHL